MNSIGKRFFSRSKDRTEVSGSSPRRLFSGEQLGEMLDRSPAPGIFMMIMVWITSAVLLTLTGQLNHADSRNLTEGQPARENVVARFEFACPDFEKIEAAQEQARREQPDIFVISSQQTRGIRAGFQSLFSRPAANDAENGEQPRLPAEVYRKIGETGLSPLQFFDRFKPHLEQLLQQGIIGIADRESRPLGKNISVIDGRRRRRTPKPLTEISGPKEAARQLCEKFLALMPSPPAPADWSEKISAVFKNTIGDQGNLRYQAQTTAQELANRLQNLKIDPIIISKGELLARRGRVVDALTRMRVAEYARQEEISITPQDDLRFFLGNLLWSLVLVIFAGFYLCNLHPDVARSTRRLSLLCLLTIASLCANYFSFRYFNHTGIELRLLHPDLALTLVPISLIAVTLVSIFGYRVSLCAGFFVTSITAMMLAPDHTFEQALKWIVVASISALSVRSANNYRTYFVRIVTSVFPLMALLEFNLLSPEEALPRWDLLLLYVGLCSGGALITGIAALLLIFCCELFFNVSTNMSLMVLCDYNHPLLERLKREAPGTFFHSLMVATLVEDAARAIGANPLKAKVGALFHDIGKLAMPQYFTENNLDSGNQHVKLNPQMSSIIIRDHVKEGLALARKYHMCRTVREAIAQHHGNDLVYYFYRQALAEAKESGAQVLESQYRYDGCPPAEKEMAILSLADACEAASRSLDKPGASQIETLVNSIFERRFKDGQLCNANLTLAELEKIRQSFINTLVSMKHGRIAYQLKEEDADDPTQLLVGEPPLPAAEEKSAE